MFLENVLPFDLLRIDTFVNQVIDLLVILNASILLQNFLLNVLVLLPLNFITESEVS